MKKVFLSIGVLFTFYLISLVFTSCNKDNSEKISSNKLASINIQDTKALFISSSNTGNKLYGVKSSTLKSSNNKDQVFEIKYQNEAGEEIKKTNPTYIYNLSNFIVLAFGDQYTFQETFLIKKSDGKVFEIPNAYMPHIIGNKYHYDEMYFNTLNKIQEDGNNNMYYTTYQTSSPHKKTLYKVSLSTPSSLQFTEVSAVNDDITGFCVDRDGNILYTYYDINTQSKKYRYRKSAGNYINFTTYSYNETEHRSQSIVLVWTGTEGQMYSVQESVLNGVREGLFLGKIQDGTITTVNKMNKTIDPNPTTVDGYPYNYVNNIFNVNGKIFYSQLNTLFNFSNKIEYAEIFCSTIANLKLNNDLYNFNQTTLALTLIDATNGSTSIIYDLDETKLKRYDINKILDITKDGIIFSAVDLNNGQYVVAKIGIDNTTTIESSISGLVSTVISLN